MAASAPPAALGYVTAAPMRNGLGIAALCCGLVGILVGLVPLMFLASSALGIVAIVFGMIGIRRISRGEASNPAIAIAGLATGVAAFALSLAGLTIVMTGLNSVSSELDRVNTSAAPATQAQHAVVHQEDRMVHQGLWMGNG